MDLQEVRQYHPQTSNGANSDRKYFISGSNFIKIDKIIERGQSEARILSSVSHPLIQKYVDSYISDDNRHVLITEYFQGETLEVIGKSLSTAERITVESQLFMVLAYLISRHVHHGDINVSNVLFDGNKICLIDFEMARSDDGIKDLFGPQYVTNHCGVFNVINILRGRDDQHEEKDNA